MEYKNREDLKLDASKYEYAKSEKLVSAFKDNHIYFPDFVHRFILLSLLKKYIFKEELLNTFTDEYQYKLRSYNYFSIYLLEKAIDDFNLDIKAHEYKNMFMRFFLLNEKKFKNSIALSKTLEQLESKKPVKEESIKVCLNEFQSIYYTPKGYLDGLSLSIFKEAVVKSYNITEMKGLASKYSIDLPKRINKSQLIGLLDNRLLLTEEEKASIETKPISEICQFAKSKGFKISSDLKKQDMVEYIIFSLDKYHEEVEKDLYNYDFILEDELQIEKEVEQENLEENDQGLPTSSELVDAPTEIEEKEIIRDYNPEDIQKDADETLTQEAKDETVEEIVPTLEPVSEEPAVEENTEEIVPIVEEYKEEIKPIEIEKAPEVYYDDTVDQEIRDIIKKYYNKKNQRDNGFRTIVIGLLVLIMLGIGLLLLKHFNII